MPKFNKKSSADTAAFERALFILGRRMGNTKLESKYLAKLMTVSPDERERESARIRLESFKKK